MKKLPLSVQTLYAELIQLCFAGAGPTGSFYERDIKGISYLYLKAKTGSYRQDFYIGPRDVKQVEVARAVIARANETLPGRKKIVQMLRKAGLRGPLPNFANLIGALKWNGIMQHCVLVGTHAYACYPPLVGHFLDDGAMGTDDADIATLNLGLASRRFDKASSMSFEDILKSVDPTYRAIPGLDRKSLPSRFLSSSGFFIDLLTQTQKRGEPETLSLPALSAGATPLQHLAWLMENPASVVILAGPGHLVDVPQPARFAIHKLIVAQKRNPIDRLKRQKDLKQAECLIAALKVSDPEAIVDAYEDACAQGKAGWADPIHKSLRELKLSIAEN
jgi:hypothetical protein